MHFKTFKNKLFSIFEWDRKINTGHILTAVALIIAYCGFVVQKQTLDVKVDKLQIIVDSLEAEKNSRVLQGLTQEEKDLNHFSYNLNYTVNQIRALEMINDREGIIELIEINKIIGLLERYTKFSATDKSKLMALSERNKNQIKVFISSTKYCMESIQFDSLFAPHKEAFSTLEEYHNAQNKYCDTLKKHIDLLLTDMEKETQLPKKVIENIDDSIFKWEMEDYQRLSKLKSR